jgi:hypothetical protein
MDSIEGLRMIKGDKMFLDIPVIILFTADEYSDI